MKEIILSVLCFHWLASMAAGAAAIAEALRRSRTRFTGWIVTTQALRAFPQSVYERQDAQSEPGFSRAA